MAYSVLGSCLLAAGGGAPAGLALDLLLVLACAGAVAVGLQWLKVSPIPGYLIAGAAIGPGALGLVTGDDRIGEISSLAVVLLMFGIGMHLDLGSVRRGAISTLLVGAGSTVMGCALIGLVAVAFGQGVPEALAIGMALSMSSTAVVLRVIQQRRELTRAYGRLSFGVLIVQDLIVIAAMAMLPVLADWAGVARDAAQGAGGTGDGWASVAGSAALRLGAVAALIFGGRLVLPRVLMLLARTVSAEVILVLCAAFALGAAVLCGALGLSPELGAFIAGFLLSATPMRYQLGGQIAPLRDLFMAVFFTAVGLNLDVMTAAGLWWVVLIGTAATLAIKALAIAGTAWSVGVPASVSMQTGLSLAQAGEFSLVILAAAVGMGLIDPRAETAAIAVAMLSLIATPALLALGRTAHRAGLSLPLPPWARGGAFVDAPGAAQADAGASDVPGPAALAAVIAGYGPVGRALADRLTLAGVSYSIIEMNTSTVRRQAMLGRSVVYGDATNPEVLLSAGVAEADAVFITIPDEEAMLRACRTARELAPRAFIAVRAAVLSRAIQAKEFGADHVTVGEIVTAEAMSDAAVAKLLARRAGQSP